MVVASRARLKVLPTALQVLTNSSASLTKPAIICSTDCCSKRCELWYMRSSQFGTSTGSNMNLSSLSKCLLFLFFFLSRVLIIASCSTTKRPSKLATQDNLRILITVLSAFTALFSSYFLSFPPLVLHSRTMLADTKTKTLLPRGSRTLPHLSLFSFPFISFTSPLLNHHHRHPRGRHYETQPTGKHPCISFLFLLLTSVHFPSRRPPAEQLSLRSRPIPHACLIPVDILFFSFTSLSLSPLLFLDDAFTLAAPILDTESSRRLPYRWLTLVTATQCRACEECQWKAKAAPTLIVAILPEGGNDNYTAIKK